MSKEIKLVNSEQVALVDDEDFDRVNEHEWYLQDGQAYTLIGGEPVRMAEFILFGSPEQRQWQ